MSDQSLPINLLELAEEFVAAMSLLPDFESCTNNRWEEVDQDKFPAIGATQFGYVDDVQISVAQIRSGGTQISFVLDHPIDEDDFLAGVSWWYQPFTLVDLATSTVQLPVRFRIEGSYAAILDHDIMLRMIRQTDDLLSGLLLRDARDILASTMLDVPEASETAEATWGITQEEQRRFFFSFYTRLATVM